MGENALFTISLTFQGESGHKVAPKDWGRGLLRGEERPGSPSQPQASAFSPGEQADAFLPPGMTALLPLQTVGESLLYMLEKCLGPTFTPAVRAAWSQLYGAVVQAMSRGWDDE